MLEGRARVLTVDKKKDLTEFFLKGAKEAFRLAQMTQAVRCIMKSRSPSCGLTPKAGVTAAFLVSKGLEVDEI